jgi:hypothetical protein
MLMMTYPIPMELATFNLTRYRNADTLSKPPIKKAGFFPYLYRDSRIRGIGASEN